MAHVSRSGVINAPAAEVWKIVGPFDGIAEWHPAITECRTESRDGATYRHLSMADGGKLLERHIGTDGTSIGYAIEESALPIQGYMGTIAVHDQGDRSILSWSSCFTANDPDTEQGLVEALGGVYQDGIDEVARRFS